MQNLLLMRIAGLDRDVMNAVAMLASEEPPYILGDLRDIRVESATAHPGKPWIEMVLRADVMMPVVLEKLADHQFLSWRGGTVVWSPGRVFANFRLFSDFLYLDEKRCNAGRATSYPDPCRPAARIWLRSPDFSPSRSFLLKDYGGDVSRLVCDMRAYADGVGDDINHVIPRAVAGERVTIGPFSNDYGKLTLACQPMSMEWQAWNSE